MTLPEFNADDYRANQDPRRIQQADQAYAAANQLLERVLAGIREIEPSLYAHANNDGSVLFDYMKGFIRRVNAHGDRSVTMTNIICAAALTKLARAPRADTNNPLAQLEKEIERNDDHN